MTSYEFMVPSEAELVEFFGAGPVERAADDGYWCYEAASDRMRLRFSFDRQERSVQTEVNVAEDPLVTVSHELATRLRISGDELQCEFEGSDCRTVLTIRRAQGYSVVWSSLRTA